MLGFNSHPDEADPTITSNTITWPGGQTTSTTTKTGKYGEPKDFGTLAKLQANWENLFLIQHGIQIVTPYFMIFVCELIASMMLVL